MIHLRAYYGRNRLFMEVGEKLFVAHKVTGKSARNMGFKDGNYVLSLTELSNSRLLVFHESVSGDVIYLSDGVLLPFCRSGIQVVFGTVPPRFWIGPSNEA